MNGLTQTSSHNLSFGHNLSFDCKAVQLSLLGMLLSGIYDNQEQLVARIKEGVSNNTCLDQQQASYLAKQASVVAGKVIEQDLALSKAKNNAEPVIDQNYSGTTTSRLIKTDAAIIASAKQIIDKHQERVTTKDYTDDWLNANKEVFFLNGGNFAIQSFDVQDNLIGMSEVVLTKNGELVDIDEGISSCNYLEKMLTKMLICCYFGQNYYSSRAQVNYTTRVMIYALQEHSSPQAMQTCNLLEQASLAASKVLNISKDEFLPISRKALLSLSGDEKELLGWRDEKNAKKFLCARFSCSTKAASEVYAILKDLVFKYKNY